MLESGASGARSVDLNGRAVLESGASARGRSGLGARDMISPVAAGAVRVSGAAIESDAMQNHHAAGASPRVQGS
ncbi:hypothetical protein RIF29_14165 [Crotalaria pallida]|uniref:Uncharacterized protein n=1 Tax=Crotalaria pallida TaxID=3830 RepID=A0AAN9FB93_CROPI